MKIKWIKILSQIIVLIIAVACSKVSTEETEIIDVDIKELVEYIDLEEYYDVEIVSLQKNTDCLIGRVSKVYVDENYILVLDVPVSKSLYLFDRKGNFIRTIGSYGKGVGEYQYLEDFDVYNGYIYLLSGFDQQLLKYGFDGVFRKGLRLAEHGGHALRMTSEDEFFSMGSNSLLSLNFWDRKGSIVKSIVDDDYSFVHWGTFKSMSDIGDTTYFSPVFDENIYVVDNKKLRSLYKYNYFEKNFPIEEINSSDELSALDRQKKYINLASFCISESRIISAFTYVDFLHSIYFREAGELVLSKNLFCKNIPLAIPLGEIENGVIYVVDSHVVNLMVENNDRSIFPEDLRNVKPDDNPIIFILKEKN